MGRDSRSAVSARVTASPEHMISSALDEVHGGGDDMAGLPLCHPDAVDALDAVDLPAIILPLAWSLDAIPKPGCGQWMVRLEDVR